MRALDPTAGAELARVARRIRATLVEVLGVDRGGSMYCLDWLEERGRWHLSPDACTVEVLVAEAPDGALLGHTIIRLEEPGAGRMVGLVSTTWVTPEHLRTGVATALLRTGEAWLGARGAELLATNTSATNRPLIHLCEREGSTVSLRSDDGEMVKLIRLVEPDSAPGGPVEVRHGPDPTGVALP